MMNFLRISLFKKLILTFFILLIVALSVLFNPYGIPSFFKVKLLEKLEQFQVVANCENIVINPFSGLTFVGLRGSYEIEAGTLFIQAKEVEVKTTLLELIAGNRKIEKVVLSGALASFYLKNSKDSYTIKEANGTVIIHDSSIEVSDTKMIAMGIPVTINGRILNVFQSEKSNTPGEKSVSQESEAINKGHSYLEDIESGSHWLQTVLGQLKPETVQKNISLSFQLDMNQPERMIVSTDANFSGLNVLKGTVQNLSLKSRYQEGKLIIKELSLNSAQGEKVSLSGQYDFETEKIRGAASVQIYPQSIIETAKQLTDMDLSEFDLITAKKKFDIELKIPNQKISKSPIVNITAFAKEFTLYGDVFAQDLSVDASWKNNALYFDITKGKVNKNTDVACKGVWDLPNDVVLLTFQVVGNPYFAHHFIPPLSAKRGFTGTLDLFTWNDALPPSINLSLRINYGENFNLQLMGDVRASDIAMSNMKYKMIETQFEVISDDKHLGISFNKINAIDSKNREMHGSIFYTIPPDGDYGKLTIDANTEVPIDEILESFELETSFLDSMQNWDGFYADAEGIYDIDYPERSKITVKGKTKKLDLYGIKIADAIGSVSFSRGQVFVPRIEGLIEGTTGFGGYYYDSETDNASCNVNFKKMDFEHASFNKKKDPIKGDLDLNVDVGLRFVKGVDIPRLSGSGKLWLHNTDSPLKIPYIGSIYSDLMKTISGGKWGNQLTSVTADLSFEKHKVLVSNLKTDGSVVAIESNGTVFLDKKEVDFVVKALPIQNFLWKLIPTLSSPFTSNATIRVKGPFDKIEWKTEFMK